MLAQQTIGVGWAHDLWHAVMHLSWSHAALWVAGFAAIGTFGVLLVTAVIATRSLRDDRRTRHGLLLTELQKQWSDPAIMTAIAVLNPPPKIALRRLVKAMWDTKAPLPSQPERDAWRDIAPLPNFIEYIGVLAHRDAAGLDPDLIYRIWGGAILDAWDKWDTSVVALRRYTGQPETFINFEELAQRMHQIGQTHKLTT